MLPKDERLKCLRYKVASAAGEIPVSLLSVFFAYFKEKEVFYIEKKL